MWTPRLSDRFFLTSPNCCSSTETCSPMLLGAAPAGAGGATTIACWICLTSVAVWTLSWRKLVTSPDKSSIERPTGAGATVVVVVVVITRWWCRRIRLATTVPLSSALTLPPAMTRTATARPSAIVNRLLFILVTTSSPSGAFLAPVQRVMSIASGRARSHRTDRRRLAHSQEPYPRENRQNR